MGKPGSQQSNLQCRIHTHDVEEEGWELRVPYSAVALVSVYLLPYNPLLRPLLSNLNCPGLDPVFPSRTFVNIPRSLQPHLTFPSTKHQSS